MRHTTTVERLSFLNRLTNNQGLISEGMITYKPTENPSSHIAILVTEINQDNVAIVWPYDNRYWLQTDDLIAVSLINEHLEKYNI